MKKIHSNIYARIWLVMLFVLALAACGDSDSNSYGGSGDDGPTSVTVRFDLNGGAVGELGDTSDVVVRGVTPGAAFKEVEQPEPYHMDMSKTFAVWNTAADGSGRDVTNTTVIDAAVTFYAVYGEDVTNDGIAGMVCNDATKIYALSYDVVLTDFTPLCAGDGEAFTGKLYGKDSELTYALASGSYDYAGLFGHLDGAYVTGLKISGSPEGNVAAGVLAATAENCVLENISVSGTPTGAAADALVGGLVGHLTAGTVTGAASSASAGFGGDNITAGGIAGVADGASMIMNSYCNGTIAATSMENHVIGGIAGKLLNSAIMDCFTNSVLSAADEQSSVGGLTGSMTDGSIDASAAFGLMINGGQAGRIVGDPGATGSVESAYANRNMLVAYRIAADSDMNGIGEDISDIKKSSAFFSETLGWDFEEAWTMPTHYDYPIAAWQEPEQFVEIATAAELAAIEEDGSYLLVADIDLADVNGTGIWSPVPSFTGVLDGNGHTIKNLHVTAAVSSYAGMFATLEGTVSDLIIEDAAVGWESYSAMADIGILAGTMNSGIVDGVIVSGTVDGPGWRVGGIIGNATGIIANSSFDGTVRSTYNWFNSGSGGPGGLTGQLCANSYIIFSSASGTVQYDYASIRLQNLGGITAVLYGTIVHSYSLSDLTLNGYRGQVGGLAGKSSNTAAVIGSYAAGDITNYYEIMDGRTSFEPYLGGMVGVDSGALIKSSLALGHSVSATVKEDERDSVTITLRAGKAYASGSPTLEDAYVNSAMTMYVNDVADAFTTVDADEQEVTVSDERSFYEDKGWDFDNVWKMPDAGDTRTHPILMWQE